MSFDYIRNFMKDLVCLIVLNAFKNKFVYRQVIILAQKFILGGRLEGTENLILERSSQTIFTGSAHTNLRYREQTMVSSSPGRVFFSTLNIHNNAQLLVQMNPLNATITTAELVAKKGALVLVQSLTFTFNSSIMTVRSGAHIDGDGYGYGANQGPGAGQTSGSSGSGGGHAGGGNTGF